MTGPPDISTTNNNNTNAIDRKSELVLSKLEKAALSLWGTQSTKSLKMKAQMTQPPSSEHTQQEHPQNFSSHLYYPQQVMEILQEPLIRLDPDLTIKKEESEDDEKSATTTNNNDPNFYNRRSLHVEDESSQPEDVPQNLSNKSSFINYDELVTAGIREKVPEDDPSCNKPFTIETALDNFQDGMRKLNENLEQLTEIKRKKLEFEIAKFKYFHPDFKF